MCSIYLIRTKLVCHSVWLRVWPLTWAMGDPAQHAFHLSSHVIPAAGASLHVRLQEVQALTELLVTCTGHLLWLLSNHQLLQLILQNDDSRAGEIQWIAITSNINKKPFLLCIYMAVQLNSNVLILVYQHAQFSKNCVCVWSYSLSRALRWSWRLRMDVCSELSSLHFCRARLARPEFCACCCISKYRWNS